MKYVFISQNIVFSFLLSLSLLIVACGAASADSTLGTRSAFTIEETPVAAIEQALIDSDIAETLQETKQQAQVCPNVETALLQLIESIETDVTTQSPQLNIQEDRVQVILVLESEDTSFLQDYAIETGTQSGNEIQAFIAISQICDLANDQQVQAIRVPASVISQ